MTINSTTRKTNPFVGNGSAHTFPFTFKVFTDADIVVKKLEASTSNETTLTLGLNNDYIVTLNADQNSNPGGSITLKSGGNNSNLPNGFSIVITSAVESLQGTDLTNQGGFFPEVINDALDKSIILHQQQQTELDRSIRFSLTNTIGSLEITQNASARANKVLGFDNAGEFNVIQELGVYRGNWSAGLTYAVRDFVKDTSTGNIFICVAAHTSSGSQPLTTNTNSANWNLIVDAATSTAAQNAASSSATAAANSATAAASSATSAAASQSAAASSQVAAASSASTASTKATQADTAKTAAQAAQTAAETALDSFDDIYLGVKSSDPTLDNDGNALISGALYFNTTSNIMRVYDLGNTTWLDVNISGTNLTNTNTVAGSISNVNAVGGSIANVNTVASNISNVNTVAADIAKVIVVANDLNETVSEIETAAADLQETTSEIDTVAGSIGNVDIVGNNISNVNTVAGISSNVTAVGSNTTNVNLVAGSISNVNNVGGSIANVNTVASNLSGVNSFAERYRTDNTGNNPSTSLNGGDLFFNQQSGKLLVYNANTSAWEETQSVGNFFINTISSFSGTGGNSATFNGSAYKFTLSNAGQFAQQMLVSIDGVVQKPNSGTGQPSEGFALDGANIVFASPPATGADYFIVTIGASVSIGSPSNDTINNAMVKADAAIAGSKINPSFTSDITITNGDPTLSFVDADQNSDFRIRVNSGDFRIQDTTNANATRFEIDSSGIVNVPSTLKIGSTGNEIEIYFDGTYDRIKANTNTLRVNVDTFVVRMEDDSRHNGFRALNGVAQLYFGDGTVSDAVICETANERLKFNNTSAYIEIPHDDRLLVFDQGQKMITSNDNSGNFNIKGGSGHTNVHINTDGSTESGLSQITLDSDGVDGKISLGVGPRRAAGQAANYTLGLTLDYVSSGLNGLKYRTGSSLSPSTLATEYNVIHAGNARDGSWDATSSAIFKVLGNGGSAALTTNDGGGNSNVTFNCAEQTADTDGSSWRIACAVDANNGHFTISNDKVVTNGGTCSHTDRFEITESGTFIGSSSNNISDERLKKNIATISDATNKIKALKGRTFEWKDEADLESGTQYGFIAQEMESVVSELVSDGKEWGLRGIDKDGNVIYDKSCPDKKKEIVEYTKGVNVSGVVPILVEALKEAIAKIETLETKVTALESK